MCTVDTVGNLGEMCTVDTVGKLYLPDELSSNVLWVINVEARDAHLSDDKHNTSVTINLFLLPNPSGNKITVKGCLLYTSPSPRDKRQSRMPSSA